MAKSQSEIESEHGRLESDSVEKRETLESGVEDLVIVSDAFDNLNMDGGTEEGMANVIDHVTQAQSTGADKVETAHEDLDETTQEVDENKDELEETAGEVNENIEVIKEVESNVENGDLQTELMVAEQSALEDFSFLDGVQKELLEIAEQSRQLADVLWEKSEAAKAKGV